MGKKLLSIFLILSLFLLNSWEGFGQCPTSVSISSDEGTEICEGTVVTFTANATGGSGHTYKWFLNNSELSGENNQTFTSGSLSNGDKVKVTVSSSEVENCEEKENTVTITVNAAAPVSFNISANKTSICPGESVTFSTGPITNGGSSPTYQWLQNGNPIANATNSTYTTTELTGTETISMQLTSNVQCAVQQTGSNGVNVTVNSLPTLTTNNASVCASGQTNIDLETLVTSNGTPSFYTSEANAINKTGAINQVVSPTAQTTYYVRSELTTGCFVTDSIVISINTLPAVDAGPDQAICPGGSFDISSIGSGTNRTFHTSLANAKNGSNPLSSPVVSPTENITYFVRSENTEGCYNTDSVTISINPLPTLSTSNASVCASGQTSIDLNSLVTTNGMATFYTSQANADNKTNAITSTVSPTSQTSYFVRSELPTGCYATETIVISIDALPTLTVTNGSVCASNQTSLNLNSLVTTNGTTVSYHSSQANADSNSSPINEVVSPLTTTTYYVRSENSQGCSNTAAIQISIDALPTVDAGFDTEICIDSTFDLSSISSGNGTLSYYTSQENAENKTSPISSSTVAPTTITEYFVRSESTSGCYSIDSVIITVNQDATITLTSSNNEQVHCINSSISAITYSIGEGGTGANVTGLPSEVTSSYNSSTKVLTISGTPTVAGTFDYTITTTGCGSASATGTITVDAPITSATPEFDNTDSTHNPTAICPVVSGLVYTVKPIPGATSYQWTFPTGWTATTGTTNAGIVTTTTNSVTVNVTSSADTGTRNISVSGSNSCGNTNQTTLSVNVDTYTYANAGPDQTVCKGTTTVQLNGEVGGAIGNHKDYDWSDNGANGTFNIQGNNKLTATYTLPSSIQNNGGTITINLTTVKPSKSSCQAATDEMVITVLKDATISNPEIKDQTLCINTAIDPIAFNIGEAGTGATVTGVPAGVTGSYNAGVFTINGTPTVSGTFNYTVNTTGTCTNQTSGTGTIQVDPVTTADTGADLVACQSSNPTAITLINASVGGGATTGAWSISSGGGTLSSTAQTANPETVTYTPAASFTGEIELTLTTNAPGTCTATTDTRKIIVEPAPTIEAGDPVTICQSSSPAPLTLSGASFGGGATTAAWSITSGGGTLSSTAQTANPQNVNYTPAVDFYGEVVLTLTSDAPGTCEEVLDTKLIKIDPVPIVDAGGPDTICQSTSPEPISLTGATVGGGASTAAWTITTGGGTLSSTAQTANPESITYTPATGYIGTVTLTLTTNTPNICTAVTDTREVTVEPAPIVDAGSNIDICQTETPEAISLTGANIGGGASTAAWSISSGGGTLSSTEQTNSPQNVIYTPAAGYTGEINLVLTTNAPGTCVAIEDNLLITINPAATINAGEDQTICSNDAATMVGSFGGGATSGTWTTSGSGTFSDNSPTAVYTPSTNDISAGSVNLTYTTNDPDGPCEAVSDSMMLTIKEEILITTQPQNVGVCVTNPASLSVVAYGDDLTYQWYKGTAPGTVIPGATSATLEFTQASLNDAASYYVTVGDGSTCTAVTSNEVTLNVNEDITIQTQPVSQEVCLGDEVSFTIEAIGAIDTYQWRKNGVDIAGANTGTFTIQKTELSDSDTYDVVIFGTGGTCNEAYSTSFTLSVNETPVVDAGNDIDACYSSDPINITANASAENVQSIEWTHNGTGSIQNEDSLTEATYTPGNNESGTITLTLTGFGNTCANEVVTKSLYIEPVPVITSFSYSSGEFCVSDTEIKEPTLTGEHAFSGGTFSINPATGLSIDENGKINPANSTPGSYEITYATPTGNLCSPVNSEPVIIVIGEEPIATFSYDADVYCKDTRDNTLNTNPVISFTEGHENFDSFSANSPDLDLDSNTGAINLSNSEPGTYEITRTVDYTGDSEDGCQPVTAVFTLTINDKPIPDFTYNATEYCSDPEIPTTLTPDLDVNGVLGNFTYEATPTEANLILDSETGEIDLVNSDAGTFIITNTVDLKDENEDSCAEVSHEFTINISKQPKADFEYTQTDYCISQTSATVIEGFQPGGTFSSTTLGERIDSETGEITWTINDAGIVGTHSITYKIEAEGVCTDASETFEIRIDALPVGGALLWANDERVYLTCEVQSNDLNDVLTLNGETGQIIEWEYRTASNLSWTSYDSQNGSLTNSDFINILGNTVESTVFRVKIGNGACENGVYSQTAILSVIPSNIKPEPVEVTPEVLCYGNEITLSSSTGYGEEYGEFEGGDFTNAGIKSNGWDFTDPNGNEINYNANADSGTPIHWHKTQPKWKFITADINSPYNTTEMWWNPRNDGKQNEHFAIAQSTYSSNMDTPAFNLSAIDEAVLTFDQAFNLTTNATIRVVLLKNGAEYKELYKVTGSASSQNYDHFGYGTPGVNQMSIDLGSYIGESNLRIRFEYRGVRLGDIWAVDNIKVPDGPQDVLLQWFYDEDITNSENDLEQIGVDNQNVVSFTPRKIGWNDFEVKTALLLDSNGDPCESINNSETIRVFVFDEYTTEVETVTGPCGNYTAELNAKTTGAFQGEIPVTDYPTLDGYVGSWKVEDTNGNEVTTGYTMINQDSESKLLPVNNPNVIFESENFGDYSITWELTPTIEDENGEVIENTGCPPIYIPAELPLLACTTLDFDGVDDYVDLGLESYAGNKSVEAWIYPEAGTGTIISLPDFELRMSDLPSGVAPNTRWYHVAVTGGELFVDGINMGNSGTGNGGARALIGATWNESEKKAENFFSGWIEEVRIWKKDLTEAQIRFMMNQHLQNTGNIGMEIPMPAPGGLTYADLEGYYRLISAEPDPLLPGGPITYDPALMPLNGNTPDLAINSVPGRLHNMTTHQQNTAPLPYLSRQDGAWTDINTWLRPDVWDIPNSTGISDPIEWNIVRTFDNITSDAKDITVLGLKSETIDKLITMANPGSSMDETNTGQMLRVTHYLLLNGNIDLVGESQLLQDSGSILAEESAGWLERDQQGKRNSFVYNYWSSPVSIQGAANNSGYTVGDVLWDGTDAQPKEIEFRPEYWAADGPKTTPKMTISTYWIWGFSPAAANVYAEWDHVQADGLLKTGEGFTMKGTAGNAGIDEEQNYTFKGKPHNGDFELEIATGQNYLIGNPYPSAIDALQFITDNGGENTNTGVFDGTIYFWDHFVKVDHILEDYIGGYAYLNLSSPAGISAISNDDRINDNDATSIKKPGLYIPVSQGFMINTTDASGGEIKFRNSQRVYERETDGNSIFLGQEKREKTTKSSEDEPPRIRLNFRSPTGYHRQILAAAIPTTTNGFDWGYDAILRDNSVEDMFWMIDEEKYVIQAVPDFDEEQVLPLGVRIKGESEFTFRIDTLENWPADKPLYLKDHLNDSIHDLRKADYKGTSEAGEILDRFEIVFHKEPDAVIPEEPNPDAEVSNIEIRYHHESRELIILNPDLIPIDQVMIFDLVGRRIQDFEDIPNQIETSLTTRPIGSSVYIVKILTPRGVKNIKFLMK